MGERGSRLPPAHMPAYFALHVFRQLVHDGGAGMHFDSRL